MKKSRKNFVVDSLAFICFVFLVSTGVILHYILPPGSGHSRSIWGMGRHDWGDIHFYFSVGFLAILVLHLFLHWRWIVNLIKGRKRKTSGRRAVLGLVGALAILAIALAPILTPVEGTGRGKMQKKESTHIEESEIKVQGSMTLYEVQESTGVPASFILEQLKITTEIPEDTKLGELKKSYDFSMDEVRDIIKKYKPSP
ncbi:MAG: DUF4405 domain-containing protein [Bacteroidia bacterium]|nr:DUF4405 domain-containing protein [Bacteroidia bacterium]NNF30195.1 DUF4405 domain-containing protein [Flavobacteriaceae bacterium]MBT8275482.1 DUF4405 domain-containing protein [Bacteroidia bacterium]NNJ81225.1 DUF4405 domain-containing protein [Flavobacteriaceae bacterium]NNK54414.1 DUF4405 domain-containing protein [Flavobacteriaceae bacterium]